MKNYGVKELASLSGISVRTLHHYDKIGLLKPLNRTEAGYRYYGEKELLRLQQILFYKELDFSLKEIDQLLEEPNFNLVTSLENQKAALKARKQRIDNLLATIDHTILQIKNKSVMNNPKDLYKGLSKKMGTTYRKEAIDKWGKTRIEQSEKDLLKLGKAGFESLKVELEMVTTELFSLHQKKPESEQVQSLIRQHYQIIQQFWGSSVPKEKHSQVYAGLGKLYRSDNRYLSRDDQAQPEFAAFMQKAMLYFSDLELK